MSNSPHVLTNDISRGNIAVYDIAICDVAKNNIPLGDIREVLDMTKDVNRYLPLTETTSYILLALAEPLHGYALMQKVEGMSKGTVKIGPGTLYTAFSTLESEGLIIKVDEQDRRKSYVLTQKGRQVLQAHIRRSEILVNNGLEITKGW